MITQKSNEGKGSQLFLVSTPIGNLEDITFRAIRILKEVDIIAAEDTRNTLKLCNHFQIETPLMSYHEHNQMHSGEKIIAYLEEGKSVALVSDAGMPCISDPGVELVEMAISAGFSVIPIPGANAALTALIASGVNTKTFAFYGFLPRNKKERKIQVEQLSMKQETIILYEAPHRLKETLRVLAESIEHSRKIVLAREITKKFEEFIRGTLEEVMQWAETNEIRGEFCIIIEGSEEVLERKPEWWQPLSIREHVQRVIDEKHIRSKDAIAEVATARNLSKREVYRAYHVEK